MAQNLHFTPEMVARANQADVTLHVGVETLPPVKIEVLEDRKIHVDVFEIGRYKLV